MTKSRNEAILENILGAENPIAEPFSRIEVLLLQIKDLIIGDAAVTSEEIDEIIETVQ